MSFSFTMPWARGRAESATAQSFLDTSSVCELEAAPKKLPSLGRSSAPALLPDNGFSFPAPVQNSPSALFPFKVSRFGVVCLRSELPERPLTHRRPTELSFL